MSAAEFLNPGSGHDDLFLGAADASAFVNYDKSVARIFVPPASINYAVRQHILGEGQLARYGQGDEVKQPVNLGRGLRVQRKPRRSAHSLGFNHALFVKEVLLNGYKYVDGGLHADEGAKRTADPIRAVPVAGFCRVP